MPSWIEVLLVGLRTAVGVGFVAVGLHIDRKYGATGRSLSAFAIAVGLVGLTTVPNSIVDLVINGSLSADVSTPLLPLPLELAFIGTHLIFLASLFLAPFFWGLFVVQYTTRLDRREKLVVRLVFTYILFAGVLFWGESVAREHLGWTLSPGMKTAFDLFWGLVLLGLMLIWIAFFVGGAIQLYRTSRRFRPLHSRSVASLVGALWIPLLVALIVISNLESGVETMIVHISTNAVGLGLLWLAVGRYGIFEQLPAARAVGRDTAIDTLETAIVVLDAEGYVTDLNVAAERLFETSPTEAIGDPIEALLPPTVEPAALTEQKRTTFRFPDRDIIVEAETATSTDTSGRALGRTIVFYDITEKRRRRQRIQVLNRVLRHNLRNELDTVGGYSTLIADGGVDSSEYAEKINTQVAELVALGETAREIEEILGAERIGGSPAPLLALVEDALADISTESTDVSITVDIPEEVVVRANPAILHPVVREVLENAIEHNDADTTAIHVTFRETDTAVVIADNGPGIPDYELSVFEKGEETPLDHGSGLGLWLVKWGIDSLGGEISFDTDTDGTEVTIQLPPSLVESPSTDSSS